MYIANQNSTRIAESERSPNGTALMYVLNRAPLRTATIVFLMVKCGFRSQVIGNFDGSDGLKIKDLADVIVREGELRCLHSPGVEIFNRVLSEAPLH